MEEMLKMEDSFIHLTLRLELSMESSLLYFSDDQRELSRWRCC